MIGKLRWNAFGPPRRLAGRVGWGLQAQEGVGGADGGEGEATREGGDHGVGEASEQHT